ncbi:PDDEXK nuclease domain-containing protein [Crateriforma conspicua]|uniref:PDDEXK nuclease domain-containing protein n=1 Tax=Crateriforma conspicua TaxID=2527996 RepID=UPI00118CB3A8|nr:PDDEXK nuclease domain-containing protein [Crateriforma conspicua]QDV63389.1 hypothetical protein Mal65_25310 [Crateriforma conspicua]
MPDITQPNTPSQFTELLGTIQFVDQRLASHASRAVNTSLTVRNWLIGFYIVEFEQHGEDRAEYGDKLISKLGAELKGRGLRGVSQRELRRYRTFYMTYPEIRGSLTPEFHKLLPAGDLEKWEALAPISEPIRDSASPVSTADLLTRLSFTHIVEILRTDTAEKRDFYAAQCISGGWSVRELKRQIASQLFERSELSTDKAKLNELTNADAEIQPSSLTIRDPYIFEFLGLKPTEVMSESHLEDQLLDKLQEFLLELGEGFCFEARQKRILIGETHNFIDLVFYHRILKCHVLVELKLEQFSYENIGQLNTYVSWFDRNVRGEGDNPPVGILLCTERDKSLVEYALAGMDNSLFVSRYQLQLPSKETLRAQIEAERRRLESASEGGEP